MMKNDNFRNGGKHRKSEKKYKGRKAYLNDFKLNDKGEYNYEGILYGWAGEEEAYKSTLRILWILGILQTAALLAAGFVEAPGIMNSFYVVLPYAISLVAGVSVLWGIGRLTAGKHPLRAYIYKASVGALPMRTVIVMVSAAIACAGELYYLIANGSEGKLSLIILYLILELIPVASSVLIFIKVQKMPWEIGSE